MSTDLGRALRDAVTDEPTFAVDPRVLAHTGRHRLRRRNALVVGAASIATAAVLVVTSLVSRPPTSDPDPAPAERTVRLDLQRAEPARLDVLATTGAAVAGQPEGPLEHARFEAVTADGLVLVNRHRRTYGPLELGLLDPVSGATDWLPSPGVDNREPRVVDLTSERLVVVTRLGGGYGYVVLVFDRESRTWQRSEVRLPVGVEVHVGPQMVLSPDDRLYFGSTFEREPDPVRWWSAPLTGESPDLRAEPELEGASVAWGDDVMVSAFPTGRIVVSGQDQERVVSERRPAGCVPPEEFPDWPVGLLVAGNTPVVTYWCGPGGSDGHPRTVIYQDDGRKVVEVSASARAADENHVVVVNGLPPSQSRQDVTRDQGTFVVDLDRLTVSRIGDPPSQPQSALKAGLVLWTSEEPSGDKQHSRPVFSVARID